jgi:hypothetical protein
VCVSRVRRRAFRPDSHLTPHTHPLRSCFDAKAMDNLSFENIGERNAMFCVADLEIV